MNKTEINKKEGAFYSYSQMTIKCIPDTIFTKQVVEKAFGCNCYPKHRYNQML